MNTDLIIQLESYTQTENQHWNEFTFSLLCVVLKEDTFKNPGLPLEIFSKAIEIFSEHHQSPLKAVWLFDHELEQNSLSTGQRLFMYQWVSKYLSLSEFDIDLEPVYSLLKSGESKLKAEKQPLTQPLVKGTRQSLKEVVEKEIESLPDTLKGLEPLQRINVLCKLLPFVLPKANPADEEKSELWDRSVKDLGF